MSKIESFEFDDESMMLGADVTVGVGVMEEPGHDCHIESHHLPQNIPVFTFEIANYQARDQVITILFPLKSPFIRDLLSGEVQHDMRQGLVRFREEFPDQNP